MLARLSGLKTCGLNGRGKGFCFPIKFLGDCDNLTMGLPTGLFGGGSLMLPAGYIETDLLWNLCASCKDDFNPGTLIIGLT